MTLLVCMLSAGSLVWSSITARRGAQRATFSHSVQSCHESGRLRYCIYRGTAGINGDVLYYLHGRNLNEQVWNDSTYLTGMLQEAWQQRGVKPPVVVTISYGPVWLLAPKGQQPAAGLLEDFMSQLPAIEAMAGAPRRRLLLGESMGGLNVLVAGLSHPSAFSRVAALCPGVYVSSPFSSWTTVRADLERTGADPKIVAGVWLLGRRYVANEDEWRRFSPLHLVSRADARYPALYLSCGLYDGYGNFEGTQRLARTAAARGVTVERHPIYGGHCATDVSSLAGFLTD
jgi:S-formylglutathione hydrolase FrmB